MVKPLTPEQQRERDESLHRMRMAGHLNTNGTFKNAYPDKTRAKRALKPSFRGGSTSGTRANDLAVYRCRYCGQWHIGHKPY